MFKFDVLEISQDAEIVSIGEKILKPINFDDRADVFCDYGNDKNKIDFPNFCGVDYRGEKYKKPSNSFSFMSYEQNPVRGNGESIYIQNGVGHRNRGVYINEKNILDVCSVFSSKRLINGDWINWYDEYTKPNYEIYQSNNFKFDSLIFSIFNQKSFQSSFYVEIDNNNVKVENPFFWMSVNRMKELADDAGYDELYNDARTSPDRHVYKLLHGPENIYDKLSPDAKAVLDKATELVERSLEMRQIMANNENHLNSWDAGYAQLKLVWKEYFPEDFKEFRQMYKTLEDRMRPLVYELGFLMK